MSRDPDDDHVEQPEAARGPGRPEIGGLVQVRLGDLLDEVETYAAAKQLRRPDAIRELTESGLVQWRGKIGACDHEWDVYDHQGKPAEAHCIGGCEATPAEVIAVTGELEMPVCGHVLYDARNVSAHINPTRIGEDTMWSCELTCRDGPTSDPATPTGHQSANSVNRTKDPGENTHGVIHHRREFRAAAVAGWRVASFAKARIRLLSRVLQPRCAGARLEALRS